MNTPMIVAMYGLKSTVPGTITFIFESANGERHRVSMLAGTLSAMLLPIVAHTREAGANAQLLTITRLRKAVDDRGMGLLEMELDRIPLKIGLPSETLKALHTMLGELISLTAPSPSGARH